MALYFGGTKERFFPRTKKTVDDLVHSQGHFVHSKKTVVNDDIASGATKAAAPSYPQQKGDRAITRKVVLEMLQVSSTTLHQFIKTGLLPPGRSFLGRKHKVWLLSEVQRFISQHHSFSIEHVDE